MSSRVFRKIFMIVFGSKWCAALSSVFFSGAPYGQKLDFNVELVLDLHMSKTVQYNMFYIRYLVSSDIPDIEKPFRCCDTFKIACETLSIVGGHEPKFEKIQNFPRSSKMSSRVFRKIFLIVFGSKWCAALSSVFFLGRPMGKNLTSTLSWYST